MFAVLIAFLLLTLVLIIQPGEGYIRENKKPKVTLRTLQDELNKLKTEVKNQEKMIMAAIDNLNTAVQGLQTTVTAVQTAVAALKTQPNNDTQIQAAADAITSATSTLNSAIA